MLIILNIYVSSKDRQKVREVNPHKGLSLLSINSLNHMEEVVEVITAIFCFYGLLITGLLIKIMSMLKSAIKIYVIFI